MGQPLLSAMKGPMERELFNTKPSQTTPAAAYFKVTVGRYYTVSGRSTQITGVIADIVIPTEYATYNIGERFLEYPLSGDHVMPAYSDPLNDIDRRTKEWFQKHYLPQCPKKGVLLAKGPCSSTKK